MKSLDERIDAAMVPGSSRLPWEDEVVHTDGTSYGFAAPTRLYGEATREAAE